jgi:uncharacterized protein involved in type VI secretion and phage assembly
MNPGKEHGVVVGIVSKRKDDDGLARVKVKIPVYGNTETDWARVAVPFGGAAGGGHGFQWIPEEGDEVLVAFAHDDPKAPIVVGSLYSQKQKPPSRQVDERVFRSRSGHTILISDESGKERIEIVTKSGQKVAIDERSGAITVKAKQKVVVDAPEIDLGGDAGAEPAVLGKSFLQAFLTHTHTVPGVGATLVPNPTTPPNFLSTITKLTG